MNIDRASQQRKVLYVTSGPQLAGAERCLFNMVCHLDPRRFLPVVLVPAEGCLAAELRRMNIDVRVFNLAVLENLRELKSPKLLLRLASLGISTLRLARLIHKERIQLVHSNTSGVLVGALAARLAGIPHIWHVREILVQIGWLWLVLQWLIPLLSMRVICISTAVKDHFRIPPALLRKFSVIPDAIDTEEFLREIDNAFILTSTPSPSTYRVGLVARINPRKGHAIFIRAAHSVIKKQPLTQFYMAGGCLPAYQDIRQKLDILIWESGLEKQVHFVGDLTLPQVAAFIKQLDILVLPSTSPEGLGLVLLEGMAFAKPVIASDAGGSRDVVIHGVTGLLVPPGDAEMLAQAMLNLLEDEHLRESLGKTGKQRLIEKFGLKANVDAIESIYCQLLECDALVV